MTWRDTTGAAAHAAIASAANVQNCFLTLPPLVSIDRRHFQKMTFLFRALEGGWTVCRREDAAYVFTKRHEGKEEVWNDDYLTRFITENMQCADSLGAGVYSAPHR